VPASAAMRLSDVCDISFIYLNQTTKVDIDKRTDRQTEHGQTETTDIKEN